MGVEAEPLESRSVETTRPVPDTGPRPHPRPQSRLRTLLDNKWVLRLIVYGAILTGWQLTAVVKGDFFLPSVPSVVRAFGELFSEGYYVALAKTLQQLVLGFLLALLIAIPIGVLMGRFRFIEDLFAPYVNTLFVTSKESLLPVIIIAFGVAFWYRTWVVIIFALFFPIINTAAGVRYVDRELRETARAFATPPWRMVTRVYLPAAAPYVLSGVRLGFGMAMKGMVIAELWVLQGTGALLSRFARAPRRLDLYYALALLIVAFAVVLNELLKRGERKLRPAAQGHG